MSTKLVTKDYLKKKDFLTELSNIETSYYSITNAFIENGVVYIKGTFKSGVVGWKEFPLLPSKYAPRQSTMGAWGVSNSFNNLARIGCVRVETTGSIILWVNNLESTENFNIQYPLKVE